MSLAGCAQLKDWTRTHRHNGMNARAILLLQPSTSHGAVKAPRMGVVCEHILCCVSIASPRSSAMGMPHKFPVSVCDGIGEGHAESEREQATGTRDSRFQT